MNNPELDNRTDNTWFENFFIDTVNSSMQKSFSYDLKSVKKLDAFDKKVIKVELLSTPFEFFIMINDRKVSIAKGYSGDVDTTIKGTPMAIFAMNAEEPIAGIKNVEIFGDANTGQFFAKWLKNLNPDWEEAWCDLLGDGVGMHVSNIAKGVLGFGKKFKDSVVNNTSTYLLDESKELIKPSEMEDFLDEVDDLKADTARLEQQIKDLKK